MRPRLAGPSTRRCALLAALMLLPQVARADLAWWLTERFKPAATAYEGLSARDIHPAWARFSVLTYAMLPPAARADVAWMRREGFAFEKDGDFNGDGRSDRALAGVYRDKAGRTGRFLLVLERQGDKWRKAFLHTEPGTPGFSIVTGPPGEVHWGTCMECDAGAVLRPRGRTYAFEKGRGE